MHRLLIFKSKFPNHFAFTLEYFMLVLVQFIGFVCRQRLCINFSISRVNFLTTLHSHLNVSCYFWSSLLNVDVNYSYILSFYCSGYLKCIEKYRVDYTYFLTVVDYLSSKFLGDK